MSRKTFNEHFADREACLLAAFEEALEQARQTVVKRIAESSEWPDRVSFALAGLLELLDSRPELAEFLFVQALAAGPRVLARRADAIDSVVTAVHEEGSLLTARPPMKLVSEGVVGAALSLIHTRLVERRVADSSQQLGELGRALTALLVRPYLGAAAAAKELERKSVVKKAASRRVEVDPLKDLPIRLTYRTARVLGSIAAAPGASSKRVALASGVSDEGQMSRLLARLERYELVRNSGGDPAKGEARAWRLTARGEGVLRLAAGR